MSAPADKTREFEAQRKRLIGLGYRMLGTMAEAEDMVQEVYLRWHKTPRAEIREPAAWLTTSMTRVCLDHLRAQKSRREDYVGPWLPEPVITSEPEPQHSDPLRRLELADDLSIAFLLMLERLAPEERAALLLHDVFDASYPDIATALGKSEAAVRQIVSRARERAAQNKPRFTATPSAAQELAARFQRALALRDPSELISLFKPDAVLLSDGGGKAIAALNPINGADRITRFLLGVTRKQDLSQFTIEQHWINGQPGFVFFLGQQPFATYTFDIDGDVITRLYITRNPDKLARICASATPTDASGRPS
jgi:RNA polymerase sigma-70 factor (ECF subfamily)